MAYVGYWSGTMAIVVLLSFNFDVVFYSMYFRFRQVKLNEQEKRGNDVYGFFFFYNAQIAWLVDAPNDPPSLGDTW